VADSSRVPLVNVANAITAVRTVATMILAVPAIALRSPAWAVAAYLAYWVGDMLDGWAARRFDCETRWGAVFDILADRVCCGLCIVPLLLLRPQMLLPCAVFLVQFMVIDLVLSLSFLRWPLLSPNYFYRVHRGVYRWNWSPPAKALNTSALVLLVVFTPTPWPAFGLALSVVAVKLVSLAVVRRIPAGAGTGVEPAPTGVAHP
jgi:phosphatidylglycerophosphate synthase